MVPQKPLIHLDDLLAILDWSAVDRAEAAWNQAHPESPIRLDPEEKARLRACWVWHGILALHHSMPIQCWDLLPGPIRAQIWDFFQRHNLIAAPEEIDKTRFPVDIGSKNGAADERP